MSQRIFLITLNQIKVFDWKGKTLEATFEFASNELGIEAFEEFLDCAEQRFSRVLVEVLEEDFQKESIPHVYGPDRKRMLGRLVDKYYRGHRYVHTEIIGREKDGRKDDEVMLASITNPEPVDLWIDILAKHQVPLVGIWSLPMLSNAIFKKIDFHSKSVLLVSRQMRSTLRESYFRDTKLVLSRQVKLNRLERRNDLVGSYISDGIGQIHKYLSNQRIIGFGSRLDVFCLLPSNLIDDAKKENADSEMLSFTFFSLEKAFAKFKIESDEIPRADTLYSYICTEQRLGSEHYHPGDEKDSFYAFMFNRAFAFAGSFGSLLLFILSAIFLIEALHAQNEKKYVASQVKSMSRSYDALYRPIEFKIDSASTIYTTVEYAARIQKEADISAEKFLVPLGDVLANRRYSSIQLGYIEWKKMHGNELESLRTSVWRSTTPGLTEYDQYPYDESEIDDKIATVLLRGVMQRDGIDYRQSVTIFDSFTKMLNDIAEVDKIVVVTAPVDTRENSRFSDRAVSDEDLDMATGSENEFEILLLLRPSEANVTGYEDA